MVNSLNDALQIAGMSDPGMVREHNEDSIFFDVAQGVVILADGMGGYNAGEVASGMATSLLSAALTTAFTATPPYETETPAGTPVAGLVIWKARSSTDKFECQSGSVASIHQASTPSGSRLSRICRQ